MPGVNDIISAQLAQRRMPKRQREMAATIQNAPSDLPMDELSPGNISELMYEIQNQRDPKSRAVLQAELDRLKEMMGNMQPLQQAQQPSPFQRLPLTQQTPPPEVQGGFRMPGPKTY